MFYASDVAKCGVCRFFIKQTVCILVVTYLYLDTKDLLTPLAVFFSLSLGRSKLYIFDRRPTNSKAGRELHSSKLSNNFGVLLVVNEMIGWIVRGIKEVQIFLHIQIHIVCTNIIAQTVCVCEKDSGFFTIFLDNMVIMECIHVKFGDI